MGTADFVSMELILADVLVFCNDTSMKKRTKGWYVSQIQQALEELSIDTFFNLRTIDLTLDKTKIQVELPMNFFNLKEVYLWSGECCTPDTWQKVHYKVRYNNKPGIGGPVGTSRRSDQNHKRDPYYRPYRNNTRSGAGSNLYYANRQNGVLMFSSNSVSYDKVRLIGNGFGGGVKDVPVIPRFLRQAAIDFTVEKYFRAEKARDPQQRTNWMDAYNALNKEFDGSWAKASYRVKSMDSWERDGILEYMAQINA